jgi:hypothetical protein
MLLTEEMTLAKENLDSGDAWNCRGEKAGQI